MKIIDRNAIKSLEISPITCLQWVKESFSLKSTAQLPPKLSVHPHGIDFITTMPCLLPAIENCRQYFGVKVVHRLEDCTPSLGSDILLYDVRSGELLSLMDGDWITAMRTGAVATLAIQIFRNKYLHFGGGGKYAFIGLGNTARSTLLCLLSCEPDVQHQVLLLKYKGQAELFIKRFEGFRNVSFTVCDDVKCMIREADVIVSCVTQVTQDICSEDSVYKPGCLVVPVHTRGFQNCDLTFDKIFADDTGHVKSFKYFDKFKSYGEIQDVIEGRIAGRESDEERILSYNIGLGLHDVLFAGKIYELCATQDLSAVNWVKESEKFWI